MFFSKRWLIALTCIMGLLPAFLAAQGRLSLPGGQRARVQPAAPSRMQAALESGSQPDPLFVALINTIERGLNGQQGGRSAFDDAFTSMQRGAKPDTNLLQQLVSEFRSATNGRSFPSIPTTMTGLRTNTPLDLGRFGSEFSKGGKVAGEASPALASSLIPSGVMEGMFDPQIITVDPEAPMGYKRGQSLHIHGRNFVLPGWSTSVTITNLGAPKSPNLPGFPKAKPATTIIRKSDLIGFSASEFHWSIPKDFATGKYILAVELTEIQRGPGQTPQTKYDAAAVYVETPPPGQPIVKNVGNAGVGKLWSIGVQRLGDQGDAQNVLMKPLDGQKTWSSWQSPAGEKVSVLKAQKSVYPYNQIVAVIPLYFPPGRYQMAVDSKSYGHSPYQEVFVQPLKASVHLSSLKCLTEWPAKAKDDHIVTICVVTSGRKVQVSVLDPLGPFGEGTTKPYANPASAVFQKGGGLGDLHGDIYIGLCIARWPQGAQTFAQRGLQPIADLAGQMASKNGSIKDDALVWSVLTSVSKLVVWVGGDVLLSQTYAPYCRLEEMFVHEFGASPWQDAKTRKLAAQPGQGPCLYEIAYEVAKQ